MWNNPPPVLFSTATTRILTAIKSRYGFCYSRSRRAKEPPDNSLGLSETRLHVSNRTWSAMTKFKGWTILSAGVDAEQLEISSIAEQRCKMVQPLWRAVQPSFLTLNIYLPDDPAISLPRPRTPKKLKYRSTPSLGHNVHSSFIHKNPKLATTQKISTGTKERTMNIHAMEYYSPTQRNKLADTGHNLDPSHRY